MRLRNTLLASTAALAIAVGSSELSFAADLKAAPAAQAAAVQQYLTRWDGFYAGVHLGYGRAKTAGCFDCGSFLLAQEDLRLRGVLGGVQLGYNWQINNIVFGAEGDLSFMRWRDKKWDTPSSGSSNTAAKVDILGSVRGRLGIAVDKVLFYGTAGIALPKAESSILNSGDAATLKFKRTGAVYGGGAEWAQTKNLRWRVEGLYYRFNDFRTDSTVDSFSAGQGYKLNNAYSWRVALNWYFN